MSNDRTDRRTSILKNPEEWADMNRTKGGGVNRRVSFHNLRTVQHFDTDHGHFRQEPRSEYFSLSSISSADEATKHSSVHKQERPPLTDLNNTDANTDQKEEVRRPLGDKKLRQSMGADDTRFMFQKSNDQGNLTLQFGARPSVNETFSDDNTQALFGGPAQQTCTEAFFNQIHENESEQMVVDNAKVNVVQSMTMNNDDTEGFLDIIASQGRQPNSANNSLDSDTLAGGISPKSSKTQTSGLISQQYNHSDYGVHLDQTAPRSTVPMRDETVQPVVQNDESPAIDQTFASSFHPEISSYVLHENSDEKDECKSIGENHSFARPPVQQSYQSSMQPSFTFGNTVKEPINFEEDNLPSTPVVEPTMQPINFEDDGLRELSIPPEQQPVLVESISPGVLRDDAEMTAEFSNQVTLYDEEGFELPGNARKPVAQETMDTNPAILMESIFLLEDSRVLKDVDRLCDKLNQTVEMVDEAEPVQQDQTEPSFQLEPSLLQDLPVANQNPLYQTYAVANPSPNLTYVVETPVVKAQLNSQESVTIMSTLNEETKLSEDSETLHKKLNETREKLNKLEDKVVNRRTSANFKQILAEAKLNRSMAQSPMAISPAKKPEPSNCPPLKQARVFNKSTDSLRTEATKSVAVPTAHQQTPQPNTRKSQQHKLPNTLQALSASKGTGKNVSIMSTPTRKVTTVPSALHFTPQVLSSAQRRNVANSALKAVGKTPNVLAPICEITSDINPLHGPLQLKSVEYIKWAQQLEFDPNWLDVERVPEWNPLPDDYLDKHGPTAGQEKTDLKRKADRIAVRTINKFDGNMYKVRQYLWDLAQANAKQAQPYKDRMWELKEQHDKLVDRYNERIAHYNQLVQQIDAKNHAEVQKFLDEMRHQVQDVIAEWTS